MRIAIIGLGVMGRAAAGALREHGHVLTAFDPAPQAAATASALGAALAPSVVVAAGEAEIVLLFLPGPDEIRSAVAEICGAAKGGAPGRGAVIVDHSTADPDTAREMAKATVAAGLGWVDAPVLGRPTAVGKWALPVGATEGALGRARPALAAYAAHVFEVGGPGAGHTIKLLNQMMFGAINAMTAEMMAAAERLGVAPGRLYEIVTASQAGTVSNLFRELGGRIAEDRYDDPTFSVALLEKDVRLAVAMARGAGIEPRLGAVVAAMNEMALAQDMGAADSSIMWKSVGDAS